MMYQSLINVNVIVRHHYEPSNPDLMSSIFDFNRLALNVMRHHVSKFSLQKAFSTVRRKVPKSYDH